MTVTGFVKPEYTIFYIMLAFCIAGAILARNRARSIIGWGVLCALFPIFLLVVYFLKPLREVRGRFRKCTACGEFIPWRAAACKYCAAELRPHE